MSHLVSGYEFHKLSKWSFCNRYPIRFNPTMIQENDIVFLNMCQFEEFIRTLKAHMKKFILITHNSDRTFTDKHASLIKPYVNAIYAINTNCTDTIVRTIPLGFSDHVNISHSFFSNAAAAALPKSILVYMNFTIKTNVAIRTACFNAFKHYPWVTKEEAVPAQEFHKQLARSKYIISPEGGGIDCHRIYESLYLDAIPLLKTSHMDAFYKKLPVIIVKSWGDITEQFLIENYSKHKELLSAWKTKNVNWYKAEFWLP